MINKHSNFKDYSLFLKFIDAYSPSEFLGIDRNDPLIMELEVMTKANNQYFFIADLLQGRIIFTSKQSEQIVGVAPDELSPYHNIEAVHPDELHRNTSGWAKLLTLANQIYNAKSGVSILSTNMKMRNPKGHYAEILYQCYLFYRETPRATVYDLQVHTNIDSFRRKKPGYHYYVGNDRSNFRFPDDELLHTGIAFSKREFEIIRLIEEGLGTEQIAEKLFISAFTVNTHRRNILQKTNKKNISDLIYEMKEQGLL